MLQINAATPSSKPLPDAGAAAERLPGDDFAALLAGLLGTVQPPAVPPEPGRVLTAGPPQTADPEAAGDAPGTAAAAVTDGLGDETRPARPTASTFDPGPVAASSATPAAAPAPARPAEPAPPAAGTETLPRAPAASLPGAVLPDRRGGTAPPALPMPERQMPSTRAEALERTAGDGVSSLQRDPARADRAPRLPFDAAARTADAAGRPVWSGPVFAGGRGGFAHLTFQVEWAEPAEIEAGQGLTTLAGGAPRGEAITAETAAARTSAPAPVQQLAAAIERAVGGDVQRLTVQLSPEALGSIEIALEVDAERRLAVVILAERPETVELLRGEARELQRLLAQQGIDLGDAGLELGLMGGERRERQPARDDDPTGEVEPETVEAQLLAVPLPGAAPAEHDPIGRSGRLNLSI